MATFRGISAVGQAVLDGLKARWVSNPFETTAFSTKLCRAEELSTQPVPFGVSAFVFHVGVNGTQRTLPPAIDHHHRPLPVEVSLLLTPWGTSGQQELELLGWLMRAIDDAPIVPPAALNGPRAGVFRSDEVIELVPLTMSADEQLRLWDGLQRRAQLSVGYVARVVRLESELALTDAGPVLERAYRVGILERG